MKNNVYLEVHKLHIVMVISFISSSAVYLVTMILLRATFDVGYIFAIDAMEKIGILTLLYWLSFYLIYEGSFLDYIKFFIENKEKEYSIKKSLFLLLICYKSFKWWFK